MARVGVIMMNGAVVGDITLDETTTDDLGGGGAMYSGPMSDLPGWLGGGGRGGSGLGGRGGRSGGRGSGRGGGAGHSDPERKRKPHSAGGDVYGNRKHPDRERQHYHGDVYDAHEKPARRERRPRPDRGDEREQVHPAGGDVYDESDAIRHQGEHVDEPHPGRGDVYDEGEQPKPLEPAGDEASDPATTNTSLKGRRARFRKEFENPEFRARAIRITLGEMGGNPGNLGVWESAMNRADLMGTTLEFEMRRRPGGYYEGYLANPSAADIANAEKNLEAAFGGSNVSDYATENASGAWGERRMSGGMFTKVAEHNRELFGIPTGPGARGYDRYKAWRAGIGPDTPGATRGAGGAYQPGIEPRYSGGYRGSLTPEQVYGGLKPEMRARLQAMYRDMPPHLREGFEINEAFRTREYQQELYNRLHGRAAVAPPGHSRHEVGEAVDVSDRDRLGSERLDWIHENVGKYGLEGILGGRHGSDTGHIQFHRGDERTFGPPKVGAAGRIADDLHSIAGIRERVYGGATSAAPDVHGPRPTTKFDQNDPAWIRYYGLGPADPRAARNQMSPEQVKQWLGSHQPLVEHTLRMPRPPSPPGGGDYDVRINAPQNTYTILRTPGGQIGQFMEFYSNLATSGANIALAGPIYSAGTLATGLIPRERLSVAPGASLGFHAAFTSNPRTGQQTTSPAATRACIQLRRIVTAANCTPARKFLASLS
jgi:hypothetical protein